MRHAIPIAVVFLGISLVLFLSFGLNAMKSNTEYVYGIDPITEGMDSLEELLSNNGFATSRKIDELALEGKLDNFTVRYEWNKGINVDLITACRLTFVYDNEADFDTDTIKEKMSYYGFVSIQDNWLKDILKNREFSVQASRYRFFLTAENVNNKLLISALELYDI